MEAKTASEAKFSLKRFLGFVVNYTGRGLVVKRPGVLSKVQMLNLVLGVGVFSTPPKKFWGNDYFGDQDDRTTRSLVGTR